MIQTYIETYNYIEEGDMPPFPPPILMTGTAMIMASPSMIDILYCFYSERTNYIIPFLLSFTQIPVSVFMPKHNQTKALKISNFNFV